MTRFLKRTLETCTPHDGTVVVIDVLRAFSTSAYAFAAGARQVIPVAGVQEALDLRRERFPSALVMGELDGRRIPEFDLGNSPWDVQQPDLRGRTLIQRTSAGTQGLARSAGAQTLLAASFVCARATARRLEPLQPQQVAFVITGKLEWRDGDEDDACADYIIALLADPSTDPAPFLARVQQSSAGRDFSRRTEENMPRDLELCMQANRFDFYQPVEPGGDGLLRMRAEPAPVL